MLVTAAAVEFRRRQKAYLQPLTQSGGRARLPICINLGQTLAELQEIIHWSAFGGALILLCRPHKTIIIRIPSDDAFDCHLDVSRLTLASGNQFQMCMSARLPAKWLRFFSEHHNGAGSVCASLTSTANNRTQAATCSFEI